MPIESNDNKQKQAQIFYYTLFKILADHSSTFKNKKDNIISLFSSTTDIHKIISERDAMGTILYEYKFGDYQAALGNAEEYYNDESIYSSPSDHTSFTEEYYDDGKAIDNKTSDNTNELEKHDGSPLIEENVIDSDEDEISIDRVIKIEQNLLEQHTDEFDYWIIYEYKNSGSILNYCLNKDIEDEITEFIITNLGNKLDVLRGEDDQNAWTPYHLAANLDKAKLLKLLLQTNQDKPISYGLRPYMSPLHVAAYKGNSEIIKILLEDSRFNDELNKHDCYGKTVLHEAVHNGNIESVNLLLSHPDVDTSIKTTRLLYPAFNKVPKEATARELALYYKHSNLYGLLNSNKPTTQFSGSIPTTQLHNNLVTRIALDRKDNTLFAGFKKNEVDFPEDHWEIKKKYKTPYGVFLSSAGEFEELIVHIQVHGLTVLNEQNWEGRNILHVACDYGRLEIIKFLLNLNSLRKEMPNITEQLHKEFVNKKAGTQHVTPIGRAIIEDWPTNVMRTKATQKSIIESFLNCRSYDVNLYYSTLHNENLLHYACKNSIEWIVKALFARKDLNPNLKDREGKVALRLIQDKSIMQIFLNNAKNFNIDVDDSFEDGPLNTALSSWSEESRFGDSVSLPGLTTNKLAEIFRTGKAHRAMGTYDKTYVKLNYKINGDIKKEKLELLKHIIEEEIEIEENVEDICCLVDDIQDSSYEKDLRGIIRNQLNSRDYGDDDFDNFIFTLDKATITVTIISRSRRSTEAEFEITRNHLVDMVSSDLRDKLKEQHLTHVTSIKFKETEQNNDFLEIELHYNLQQNKSIKPKGSKNIIKQLALERGNLRLTCDVYSNNGDVLTEQHESEIRNAIEKVFDIFMTYFSQKKPLLHYFVEDAVKRNNIELLSLFLQFPKLNLQQPNDQLKLATSLAKGNKNILKLLNDALKQSDLVGSTIRSSSAYSAEYKEVALSQIQKKEAKQILKKHKALETYSTDYKKGSISTTNSMLAHFRGIHFNTKYFTPDQRRSYGIKRQDNKAIFAADCYTNSGVDFNHELTLDEINSLNSISVRLHEILYKGLDYERKDQRAYYSFVQNYVLNEASELQLLVQEAELIIQQASLRSLRHPFVSTGKVAYPAVKFSSASSGYRELNPDILQPKYRPHGVPKHRLLGIMYLTMHTIEDYDTAKPFDVPKLYRNQEIQLPLQRDGNPKYLSQVEVAFVGNIEAKNVAAAIPFIVPNFARGWDLQFQKLYGINQQQYNYYKNGLSDSITQARIKKCNQEDILRLIEQELIRNLEFHYSNLLGSIAESIAAEQIKRLLIAMPDGSYTPYNHQQEKQIKDQIIAKSMQRISQRVIPAEPKSFKGITHGNSIPSEAKKPSCSDIASRDIAGTNTTTKLEANQQLSEQKTAEQVKPSKSNSYPVSNEIKLYLLENNVPALDIDVLADGNCLFYGLIMSYLLPHINNEPEFVARHSKIFIGNHKGLLALMRQYDGSDTWYKRNLYSLVNGNVLGLRSKLADYFYSIKEQNFRAKVIEQFEKLKTKQQVYNYIKQANVFGNMGEMMLFASLTNTCVACYNYYSLDKPQFIYPNAVIRDEMIQEIGAVDVIRVFFVLLEDGEGNKVGHYHFLIPKNQLPQVVYSKLGIDTNSFLSFEQGSGNNANTNLRIAERSVLHALQLKHLQKFLIETKDTGSIIHAITNSEDILALPGSITLIEETDHVAFHKYNILRLINMLYSDTISSNTVICLERKQYGNNFGMQDVVLLAEILQTDAIDNLVLPEYIRNLPIYYDAMLYNVAQEKGVMVMGIEGKGLVHPKSSPYYHHAREEYMSQELLRIVQTGKNAVFLVGSAHINNLVKMISANLYKVNANKVLIKVLQLEQPTISFSDSVFANTHFYIQADNFEPIISGANIHSLSKNCINIQYTGQDKFLIQGSFATNAYSLKDGKIDILTADIDSSSNNLQPPYFITQHIAKYFDSAVQLVNDMMTNFAGFVLNNNYIRYQLLNYAYHQELTEINHLLSKEYVQSSSLNGIQTVLQKHPYEWSKQDFRKIKLIVHPDKGGSAEDFHAISDFETLVKDTDKIFENLASKLSEKLEPVIKKINLYAKEVDVVTDIAKLYIKPSTEHAITTVYDSLMLYHKFYTDSKLGYFVPAAASVSVLSNLYQGEYLKAGVSAIHSYSHYLLKPNLILGDGNSVFLGLNGLTVFYDLYNGKYTAAAFQVTAVTSMYFAPAITGSIYAIYYTGQNLYSLFQVYQEIEQQNLLGFSRIINNLWKKDSQSTIAKLSDLEISQDDFNIKPSYYWNIAHKEQIETKLPSFLELKNGEWFINEIIDNLAQTNSFIISDSVAVSNEPAKIQGNPIETYTANNLYDYLNSFFKASEVNLNSALNTKFSKIQDSMTIIKFVSISQTHCRIHGYVFNEYKEVIQYEFVESTNSDLCGSILSPE